MRHLARQICCAARLQPILRKSHRHVENISGAHRSTSRRRHVEQYRACFGDKARDYSDTLFTIKTRLGIGDNRAKEILARAVSDGLVQASKEGRKTFYALNGDAV